MIGRRRRANALVTHHQSGNRPPLESQVRFEHRPLRVGANQLGTVTHDVDRALRALEFDVAHRLCPRQQGKLAAMGVCVTAPGIQGSLVIVARVRSNTPPFQGHDAVR